MIKITEHNGYINELIHTLTEEQCAILKKEPVTKYFDRKIDKQLCFSIVHNEESKYKIDSSYIIGVDWVVEKELAIYVEPKLNKNDKEIDYLKMLFEALEEPVNFNHLEGLYTIDFNAPQINIEQQQDKLTPLLLLEFLQLVKKIVRKGLKKSYYKVTKNLNSRVKGKILVNATIKQNHSRQKMLYNVCQYEEFGYNSLENRIIKKALMFTQSALSNLKGTATVDLKEIFNYIAPAFHQIDENIDIRTLKNSRPNPLFKEYTKGLKLAKLILKKYGYNISNTTEDTIKTPPFWIDMSKLFELYVYKKLREVFKNEKEVIHLFKASYQELDYLINAENGTKIVVDAKYKNRYVKGNISIEDARQVCGYSRLKTVYSKLEIKDTRQLIDCLIIYPNQSLDDDIDFTYSFNNNQEPDNNYVHLNKLGIKLPEIEIKTI